MQQCGISTVGAMAFQPVLKFNTTVSVLDLRLNPLIGKSDQNNIFINCYNIIQIKTKVIELFLIEWGK